jgi:hypothetical protein
VFLLHVQRRPNQDLRMATDAGRFPVVLMILWRRASDGR